MDRFKLRYKGYTGSIEFNRVDKVYYGEVQYTNNLIAYNGESLYDLEMRFKETVEKVDLNKKEMAKFKS